MFGSLHAAPIADQLQPSRGGREQVRRLEYRLPRDAARATAIVQRVLREVDGVKDADGLRFSYADSAE
jgi:ketosteroid isomerase-like protein